MSKFLNRIILLTLISSVIAVSGNLAFAADEKYSLFELKELLTTNNNTLISMNEEVERAKTDYLNAKTISTAVDKNLYKEEGYDKYNLKLKEELNPLTTLNAYKDKLYSYESSKNDITNQLTSKYYEYINLKDSFDNEKAAFEVSKKEYESKEKQLELGIITTTDFNKFKKEYNTKYFSIYSSDLKIKNLQREILAIVGKDVSGVFDIDRSSFSTEPYKIDNVDNMIASIIASSYEIENLNEEKAIAEKELEFKTRFAGFSNTKLEMDNLNFKIKDYDRQLEDKKRELEYKVRTDYNNILIEEENLNINKLNLDIATAEYSMDQVKFDKGYLSDIDYQKSLDKLKDSVNTYNESRLSYFNKVNTFKSWMELQLKDLDK